MEANSTSENNKLLASAALLVAEMLGVKTRPRSGKCANEPYWKKRIANNVKTWRKQLSKFEEICKGNHVLCEKDKKEMIWKYGTEATGYINVISQLKVKIHNCSIQMKNYEIKREQFQQKRMFRTNAFLALEGTESNRQGRLYITRSRRS